MCGGADSAVEACCRLALTLDPRAHVFCCTGRIRTSFTSTCGGADSAYTTAAATSSACKAPWTAVNPAVHSICSGQCHLPACKYRTKHQTPDRAVKPARLQAQKLQHMVHSSPRFTAIKVTVTDPTPQPSYTPAGT